MKLTLRPSVNSDRFPWVVVAGEFGKQITNRESRLLIEMRAAYFAEYQRQNLAPGPGNLFYFLTEEEGMIFVLRWSGEHDPA